MQRCAVSILAAILVLVAGCRGGESDKPTPPATSSKNPAVTTPHEPGAMDVRVSDGRTRVTPNFFYFKGCGHPCSLGVYSSPRPKPGAPLLTKDFPLEGGYGEPAQWADVVCKVQDGKHVQNDVGSTSATWVKLRIPSRYLTGGNNERKPEYYAPDMWTGNTGLPHVRDC